MSQVSSKLRRAEGMYVWFCPACQSMHPLPDRWKFDGNLEKPTFSPSFRHGPVRDWCCHYIITAGKVSYCSDCTHDMKNQIIDMPDLPEAFQDDEIKLF